MVRIIIYCHKWASVHTRSLISPFVTITSYLDLLQAKFHFFLAEKTGLVENPEDKFCHVEAHKVGPVFLMVENMRCRSETRDTGLQTNCSIHYLIYLLLQQQQQQQQQQLRQGVRIWNFAEKKQKNKQKTKTRKKFRLCFD